MTDYTIKIYSLNAGFSDVSRRNEEQEQISLNDAIDKLPDMNSYPELAVDGTSGVGKTTLLQGSNRTYLKINNLYADIAHHNFYNVNPLISMDYAISQTLYEPKYAIWDRSPVSNLAWQLIHPLMAIFADRTDYTYEDVFPHLTTLAQSISLLESLEMLQMLKPIPILFIINTNYKQMKKLITNRAKHNKDVKDALYGVNYGYCIMQSYAYKYIADTMRMPLFDIGPHLNKYSINEISTALLRKVSYIGKAPDAVNVENMYLPSFIKYTLNNPQTLMYNESKK